MRKFQFKMDYVVFQVIGTFRFEPFPSDLAKTYFVWNQEINSNLDSSYISISIDAFNNREENLPLKNFAT